MIRPARPGDVSTIVALIKELAIYEREPDAAQATEADLRDALFGPHPAVFALIAEATEPVPPATPTAPATPTTPADPLIAGFALWFLNFSTWVGKHGIYLEDLYVRPEFRGHGYGKALLIELAGIAGQRGYERFEWSVLDWNEPARRFYRSLGAGPMDQWTVWRLAGPDLTRLGTRVEAPGRGTVSRGSHPGPPDQGTAHQLSESTD